MHKKNVKYTPSKVWQDWSQWASQATWAVTAKVNGGIQLSMGVWESTMS